MYILLEYVTWVVLVAGAVAALLAVGWTCVALVQILYRAAGRLLPRSSPAALRFGRSLFNMGDNRVAVKVSTREERPGLVPRDRSVITKHRGPQ
jgi:hypothetical protein